MELLTVIGIIVVLAGVAYWVKTRKKDSMTSGTGSRPTDDRKVDKQ